MSMGVYIKNMEIPTSCPCELLGIGYDLCCSFVGGIPARVKEYYECCQNGTRPSWCPLVPVPPHGRLIDADAFIRRIEEEADKFVAMNEYDSGLRMGYRAAKKAANLAPTVIEAEEGE